MYQIAQKRAFLQKIYLFKLKIHLTWGGFFVSLHHQK